MHEHSDETLPLCDLRECSCGRLTLRVGRVRLDLTRAELAALHHLLVTAADEWAGRPRAGTLLAH